MSDVYETPDELLDRAVAALRDPPVAAFAGRGDTSTFALRAADRAAGGAGAIHRRRGPSGCAGERRFHRRASALRRSTAGPAADLHEKLPRMSAAPARAALRRLAG